MSTRPIITAAILTTVLLALATPVGAATRTWLGDDAFWSNPDNWSPAGVPQNGDALTFPVGGPFTARSMNNDLPNLTINFITFNGAGYSLNGNVLTLIQGITDNHVGEFNRVRCNLQFVNGGGRFNSLSAGELEVSGNTTLANGDDLIVTPLVTNITVSGAISGSGGLIKRGDGALFLRGSGANTYTGRTRVQGGRMHLAKTSAARAISADVTIDGDFIGNASLADELPGQYPPVLSMVIVNDGIWRLTNGATVTNLFLSDGDIFGTGLINLECDVIAEGDCFIFPALNLGSQTRRFVVNQSAVADGEVEVFGSILAPFGPNTSGVIKEGEDRLFLYNQNTYLGPTLVKAGALSVQHDGALGAAGPGRETRVQGGVLQFGGVTCPETIIVEGPFGEIRFVGNVTLTGPLMLNGTCSIGNLNFFGPGGSDARFEIAGVIDGPGGLRIAAAIVRLSGTAANTFVGGVNMSAPSGNSADIVLELAKSDNVLAVPGRVSLSGPGTAVLRNFQDGGVREVTLSAGCSWDLNGHVAAPQVLQFFGFNPFVETGPAGQLQFTEGAVLLNSFAGGTGASVIGQIAFLETTTELRLAQGSSTHFQGFVTGGGAILQTALFDDEPGGTLLLESQNNFTGPITVEAGQLIAAHRLALGSAAGGTFVTGNGSLALDGDIDVQDEMLTLDSTNAAALVSRGFADNTWSGPIRLQRTAGIRVTNAVGSLTFAGSGTFGATVNISGPGGFTKSGPGALRIAGLQGANTFTGPTTVTDGLLEALRQGSLSGNIVVAGANSTLRTASADGLFPARTVLPFGTSMTVQDGALWAMNGTNFETLGRLVGDGRLDIGPGGALTISNGVSCEFSGQVSGTGALNKRGLASFRVTGNSPGYTGLATVFDGTYKVDAQFLNSPVTVKVSATLRGNGDLGDVTVENGGVVKVDSDGPGRLGGYLTMRSASFQNGSVLGLGFYGPHPTGGNDHLGVANAVTLTSPTLSSGFQYAPREGDVITLIDKSEAGAVIGALGGFPEGALRNIDGIPVVMSYVGGDGNDVTLTVTNLPLRGAGTTLATSGGGPLGPDDCSQLWPTVTNHGAATLTGLRGALRSLTPGVLVTRAESAYPDLAPNARGTNIEPFQIRTEPTFPCGSSVQFELVLTASNMPPIAIAYTLPGASGFGLEFDGRDDRVQLPVNAFPGVSNNFTIELWANPGANRSESAETSAGVSGVNVTFRQLQRFAVFPDRGDLAYGLTHASAGLSIGRNGVSAYEHSTNAPQGIGHLPSRLVYSNALSGWTHVALVYTNRRPRLYVNGVLERSSSAQSLFPFVHASGSLGGSSHGGFGNFDGQLDEVRIWNTARTAEQIQTNMLRSLTGTEPNLVTYFRCDAGSSVVLADNAPASPNPSGTLIGGVVFVMPGVVPFGPPCNSGGACESCFVVNGQFGTGALESVRRLQATGLPSVCVPPKPCPDFQEFPDDPVRHVVHHFTNGTPTELCVTAQLRPGCHSGVGYLGAAAYLGEFRINQPCSNFLGDDGAGAATPPPFSFRVPPQTNFILVVTARTTNLLCDSYALELFGLPCPPPTLYVAKDAAPDKVRLHWSSAYPDFHLQSVDSLNGLGPRPFNDVTTPPVLVGGQFAVTNAIVPGILQRFYRLRTP